ncbi:MAG TPA: hypothetical protein DCQ31_12590 [Bacteroidales bacterium]|nr:hypothetical protein [Bacteroidales bacterium]
MKKLVVTITLLLFSVGIFAQTHRYTVYFETGKCELNAESLSELEKVATQMKAAKKYSVEIIGHTDSVGDEVYNINLSLDRATAVHANLLMNGVNSEYCSLKGVCFNQPVLPNTSENNRSLNRRVEIFATIENEPIIDNEIYEEAKDTTEKITFTTEKGSTVKFDTDAFAPYKIADLNIKIEEIFDPLAMIENKILTQTTTGNCLSSFGMLFIRIIKPDSTEIGNANSLVEIKIPAIKGIDKKVELFSSVKEGENTVWKPMEGKLLIDSTDNKPYYVFYTTLISGYNLDKIIPCGTPTTLTQKLYVSRLKRMKVYVINPITNNVQLVPSIGKNRYQLSYSNPAQSVYIKSISKKNEPLVFNKSIYNLKYSKFRKAFIIRKSEFNIANSRISPNEFGEVSK